MRIPVFVSCPTDLSDKQNESRSVVLRELSKHSLEPRALGRSDYPTDLPLREVLLLAKHCAGGVILGFEQLLVQSGVVKRGTIGASTLTQVVPFPTPWNHLEAGILFALRLPLIIFCEEGISGGVFDHGVTDYFVHPMPLAPQTKENKKGLSEVFRKWQGLVRAHYYAEHD